MAKQRNKRPVRRRDKRGGPGSGRRKPCPYCKDKIEQVDYKDVDGAPPVHLREGQDPLAPHHRRLPPAPEPDRPRGQARPRARAPAVRQRVRRARGRPARPWRPRSRPRRALGAMPQAILLQDVENVGERGSGRRRLQGLPPQLPHPAQARRAGDEGARSPQAQQQQAKQEHAAQQARVVAEQGADVLNRTVLTIAQQAGEDGRLFGSVTTQDIADAIKDARGIEVDRRKIHLDEPIRHVGTFMVVVEVADGVTATVKTIVSDTKYARRAVRPRSRTRRASHSVRPRREHLFVTVRPTALRSQRAGQVVLEPPRGDLSSPVHERARRHHRRRRRRPSAGLAPPHSLEAEQSVLGVDPAVRARRCTRSSSRRA